MAFPLGHPSAVISSLSDIGGFSHNVRAFVKSCDICVRALQTRGVFSQSYNKADEFFSLIHCDLWGPYKTPSLNSSRYFLTIVFSSGLYYSLTRKEGSTNGS